MDQELPLNESEVQVTTGNHWRLPGDFLIEGEKPQVQITVEGSGSETLSVVAYDMAGYPAIKLFATNNEEGPLSHTDSYTLDPGLRRLRFVMLGVDKLANEERTNTAGHPTRKYICKKPPTVGDGIITITIVVQAGTIPDLPVI